MSVDEAVIKAAIKARRNYIISNLESMSLKSCRQTLEEDMGLEKGALKPYKALLSAQIDKIIAKQRMAAEQAARAAEQEEAEASEGEAESAEEEEEGGSSGKKQRKRGGGDKPSKRQKRDEKPVTKQSGPRIYSKRVEKLRGICKAATITVPPNIYRGNPSDEQLQEALEALLEKHGLDANAGAADITAAKSKLQIQRDLDGIDTSNIIEGGRRRRGAAPTSFKAMVAPASDGEEESEEEEQEESGSESEGAAGSDGEADSDDSELPAKAKATPKERQQKPKQQQKKAKKAQASESEEEAASSSEEEEEAEADSYMSAEEEEQEEQAAPKPKAKPAAATAAAAKSPDENAAARGNGGSGRKGSKSPAAAKVKPAAEGLEDSDGEQPVAAAGKRRVMVDWSDED